MSSSSTDDDNSNNNNAAGTLPTKQDKACAVLVREALFPLQKDWNEGHHVQIHPALDVLDKIRKNLVTVRDTPFSNLFPRKVILVPVPGTSGREMQWNGQPDVTEDCTVEIVPDVLNIHCKQCPIDDVKAGIKAYISKSSNNYNHTMEMTVCSNAVLGNDYEKFARLENVETLLELKRDLPKRSLQTVEETLAHELTKLQVNPDTNDYQRPLLLPPTPNASNVDDCHTYAQLELLASRAAECMYEKRGSEVRKGTNLRPSLGFSLLPSKTQQEYISRCTQEVAIRNLTRAYGRNEATKCVKNVGASTATATTGSLPATSQ
jgi:hypothetical protein